MYQYNDDIKNGILDYAKKMCVELNAPNMPIYVGPKRHKVNFDEYSQVAGAKLKFVGSTGNDKVYIDWNLAEDNFAIDPDKEYQTNLFKIR